MKIVGSTALSKEFPEAEVALGVLVINGCLIKQWIF